MAVPRAHAIDPALLLRAYANGVFPMAESASDPEVFWVRPEARGIIPLDAFHMPRRLARTIRRGVFDIRFDTDFPGVIAGCAERTEGRPSTWINAPIREAYGRLFAFARKVAIGLKKAVPCRKVGVAVVGLEVAHTHIHLVPMDDIADLNFKKPRLRFTDSEYAEIAASIQKHLQ